MCGISGELTFNSQKTELSPTLKIMNDKLMSRGPDSEGFYIGGPIQLGHRRLSIIDLSNLANQPMVDEELGLALVFNGTIYNYVELREILKAKGYQFKSTGDTEVLLKSYHFWGRDCVNQFKGIFAFAIWNIKSQELFLARDQFGIKPLYFSQTQNCFRFSSNLTSILAAAKYLKSKINQGIDFSKDQINLNLDQEALQFYFHLHAVCPAPRTLIQGVRKLGPGEWMVVQRNGHVEIKKYYDLKVQSSMNFENGKPNLRSDEEWTELLKDSLWKAVRRQQLAADVPVGIFLSGGLDSSLLVAIFHELGLQNIKTFSLGFEEFNGIKADEFEFSDAVAKMYNTDHHKYLVPYSEMLNQIPNAVEFMAEPMFSTDVTAFYLLSQRARDHVKVVHCGQGADEVLGGYFWYPRMEAESSSLAPLARFEKHYVDRTFKEYSSMISSPYFLNHDLVREMLAGELSYGSQGNGSQASGSQFMDAVFKLDVTKLIVDDPVKRIDNMTMAHGIDARVPFLDIDFVELAMQVPPSVKLKMEGKYPLKLMSRGKIPDSVIDRPKGYFPVPVLRFVKGPYFDFMKDILNSQLSRNRNLFQRSYIDNLIANPQSDFTPIQGNKLWHLSLFELWLQKHL